MTFPSARIRRVICWLSSSPTTDKCYNSLASPSCSFSILSCSWSQFLMLSNCVWLHCMSASYAKVEWQNHLSPKGTSSANVALNSEWTRQIHRARSMFSTVLWMQPLAQAAPGWLTVRRQGIVVRGRSLFISLSSLFPQSSTSSWQWLLPGTLPLFMAEPC